MTTNKPYKIQKQIHPLANAPIWYIDDIDITNGGLVALVTDFINAYKKEGYTLSIYNLDIGDTIEIDCKLEEMPEVAQMIFDIEHAMPIQFIGLNPSGEAYSIGMTLTKGRIETQQSYKYENKKLVKCEPLMIKMTNEEALNELKKAQFGLFNKIGLVDLDNDTNEMCFSFNTGEGNCLTCIHAYDNTCEYGMDKINEDFK